MKKGLMVMIFLLMITACTSGLPEKTPDGYPGALTTPPIITPNGYPTPATGTTETQQPAPESIKDGVIKSNQKRIELDTPAQDYQEIAANMNAFGYDLYHLLSKDNDTNFFFSPYSITQAMAMTLAGARGETETEMANVLHFQLSQDDLHSRINGLDQSLYRVPENLKDMPDAFQLNVANTIWGQSGYPFKSSYLDLIAESYGAGIHLVDFVKSAEKARITINKWVANQTNDKIKDLISPGALDSFTRLVLTNAIYFNATWQKEFNKKLTHSADFATTADQIVPVDMMEQKGQFNYQYNDEIQMIEIPYMNSRYSMVLLMPRQSDLNKFIQGFDLASYNLLMKSKKQGEILLKMPKFEFESSFSVSNALKDLGMTTPFTDAADFSGMYEQGAQPLYISDVIHKAFVAVDEEGTEAAAATAVIVGATSVMPEEEPLEMIFNHPFMLLIRDRESGLILFLGNVINPAN